MIIETQEMMIATLKTSTSNNNLSTSAQYHTKLYINNTFPFIPLVKTHGKKKRPDNCYSLSISLVLLSPGHAEDVCSES